MLLDAGTPAELDVWLDVVAGEAEDLLLVYYEATWSGDRVGWGTRVWSWLQRTVVGYGYQPTRSIAWFLACLLPSTSGTTAADRVDHAGDRSRGARPPAEEPYRTPENQGEWGSSSGFWQKRRRIGPRPTRRRLNRPRAGSRARR